MEESLQAGTADIAEDGVLIDAACAGSTQAFAELYDRYLDRVYRHVYYRVGNRADAEDLTQQVFLQAWNAIGRFKKTGAPFVAWLMTIAHNLVVSMYRRAKDVQSLELEPETLARWASPEAETLAEFDRESVREAILRLKADQQQVVIMRFVEDIDYPAIAAAIGKSEGNVRVIQHRALQELRRLLAHKINS